MAEYRKQHYVPQSFLKPFSQDGENLYVYNLKLKDTIKTPVNIKNLCQSKYFYSKDVEYEKIITSFEDEHHITLRKIIIDESFKSFTQMDFLNLFQFILFQYSRTQHSKTMASEMGEILSSPYLKKIWKSNDEFKNKDIDNYSITFPELYKRGMELAITGVEMILDLKPVLVKNKTNRKFIVSCAPLFLYNSIKLKNQSMTGFQSPGLQIFCPINENILLLLIDINYYKLKLNPNSTIILNNKSDVDSINKLQFFNCRENVFYSDENDRDYLKNLHGDIEGLMEDKYFKSRPLETIKKSDGSQNENILIENTIKYKLKLSFIKLNHTNNRILKNRFKKLSKSKTMVRLCRNEEISKKIVSRSSNDEYTFYENYV